MQLPTYIKDLLYRYECVIVPGFGAFLTQRRSAYIEADHTFHPPSKYVTFNKQLQTNDGLLANYVASSENISYESALQQIRYFTADISKKLNGDGQVSLDHIGEFSISAEGSVSFNPSGMTNFDSTAFGLGSFVSPEISRIPESVVVEAGAPAEQEVRVHPAAGSRSIPVFRYAAIGLIAIALSSLGGMKLYEGSVERHNFAEKQKADDMIEQKIEEATFIVSEPLPALTVNVPEVRGKYHIMAGAFRIEENAEKKLNQLLAKGYHARIIGKNRYDLHQVIYGSYVNRLDALKELRRVKSTENPDAWLLVE